MMYIGGNITKLKTVGSTNEYLLRKVSSRENLTSGDVYLSYFQTDGQGIGDNKWESEDGKNLTFSIYLQPAFLSADKQFILNKFVSLALHDFVSKKIPDRNVSVKWPNDIYIDNYKVAGILINNTIQGNQILNSIIGIGININQTQFLGNAPNPISLINYLSFTSNLDECLNGICKELNFRYLQLVQNEYLKLDNNYEQSLFRLNQFHQYKIAENGELLFGKITGVANYGQLKVSGMNEEKYEFGFKEVEFIF